MQLCCSTFEGRYAEPHFYSASGTEQAAVEGPCFMKLFIVASYGVQGRPIQNRTGEHCPQSRQSPLQLGHVT